MNIIQHTATLVYYDGVQVFEGRDPIGGCYVGMMTESLDDIDRYLITGVAPGSLRLFRSGALDLKTLLLRGAEHGWYIAETNGDFTQQLVLQAQSGALIDKDFLPDDGFLLYESVISGSLATVLGEITTSFQELERELQAQICESVYIVTKGDGKHYITTPFSYGDGDGPVIALRRNGKGWVLSDEGNTMMRLSWRLSEKELKSPERQRKIADALALSQASQKDGELFLQVNNSTYGKALFDFVHSLLIVDELGYPENPSVSDKLTTDIEYSSDWQQETFVAASNAPRWSPKRPLMPIREFKNGFISLLEECLPQDRLNFNWHDPEWDTASNYTVDCMVNGMASPLFLHAPATDIQVRDTTFTIYRFNEQEVEGHHAAIFRDASRLTKKVISQLDAVCDVQFDGIENERERIREYLQSLR